MENLLLKKVFFYANKRLYQFGDSGLELVDTSEDISFPTGLIIVGREHTKERLKKLPVTDLQDIKLILRNELEQSAITGTPNIGQTNSEVFVWELESATEKKLQGSYSIWLPETLLFTPEKLKVNVVKRADNTLFALEQGNYRFSSIAKGAMSSPSYFLMTLGIPEQEERVWSETDYIKLLQNRLRNLERSQFAVISRAQKHLVNNIKLWPFRSFAAGLLAGWMLLQTFQYAQLTFRHSGLQEQLQSQDIAAVVKAKQDMEEKVSLLQQLSTDRGATNQERQLWHVLGSIMEANLTIIRFRTNAKGVEVRLESEIATDGLEAIKAMPGVASAEFAAAIQNSIDKQRFTVDIVFGAIEAGANDATE